MDDFDRLPRHVIMFYLPFDQTHVISDEMFRLTEQYIS